MNLSLCCRSRQTRWRTSRLHLYTSLSPNVRSLPMMMVARLYTWTWCLERKRRMRRDWLIPWSWRCRSSQISTRPASVYTTALIRSRLDVLPGRRNGMMVVIALRSETEYAFNVIRSGRAASMLVRSTMMSGRHVVLRERMIQRLQRSKYEVVVNSTTAQK